MMDLYLEAGSFPPAEWKSVAVSQLREMADNIEAGTATLDSIIIRHMDASECRGSGPIEELAKVFTSVDFRFFHPGTDGGSNG